MTVQVHDRQPAVVPHPRLRVPVLGDILTLRPRHPVRSNLRATQALGPVFERRFLGNSMVFVSDPDLVAELCDDTRFAKQLPPPLVTLRGLGGDALFTAYNEEPNWARAHQLLQPAFTQAAMRGYHDTMTAVADELVRYWAAAARPVDVSADMTKLTLETIGRTGFGFSFDSFSRARPHPFVGTMIGALAHAQLRTFLAPKGTEWLWRWADRRNRQRVNYLHSVVDEVIRQRRRTGHTGAEDLLERMLRAQRTADPNRVDDANIRLQVITFLIAGHETTSGALSFALYYLAANPQVGARARAEVASVWGSGVPSFEQVAKLRYVRRVLDETLRMWPTAPGFARAARADTVLGDRYPLRAGDGMLVFTPALHRDPAVWGPDADRFDPEHFAADRVHGRSAHAYKPFGTGERACIGRQFAIHEAVLVLGTLLREFDFATEADYTLRVQERLTLMPEGFRLHLSRRVAR